MLTGIWHGANWTFVAWGLLYFVLLVAEKFVIYPDHFKGRCLKWSYRVFVFVTVMFLWVIFRSDSIRAAGQYLKSMLGLYGNPLSDNGWLWYSREYVVFIVLGLLLSTPIVRYILQKIRANIKPAFYEIARGAGYIFLFVICVSYLVTGAHNPFIYFNF